MMDLFAKMGSKTHHAKKESLPAPQKRTIGCAPFNGTNPMLLLLKDNGLEQHFLAMRTSRKKIDVQSSFTTQCISTMNLCKTNGSNLQRTQPHPGLVEKREMQKHLQLLHMQLLLRNHKPADIPWLLLPSHCLPTHNRPQNNNNNTVDAAVCNAQHIFTCCLWDKSSDLSEESASDLEGDKGTNIATNPNAHPVSDPLNNNDSNWD